MNERLLGFKHWAHAPGSCMVFGEHAVLRGYPAIVMAIEPRLRVDWKWRDDNKVKVIALGQEYEMTVGYYQSLSHLSYLRSCLELAWIDQGFELQIVSDLDPTIGFGTSAALVIALLTVQQRAGLWNHGVDLLKLGLKVLNQVQGRGSGADLAASLAGGIIVYKQGWGVLQSLPALNCPMELIYAGHKTPTSQVLAQLAELEKQDKLDLDAIERMGRICELAVESWLQHSLVSIRQLASEHQSCMRRLGLCDADLDSIEKCVNPHIEAGKISGSGLGDCYLTWGRYSGEIGYRRFPVQLAEKGVCSGSDREV